MENKIGQDSPESAAAHKTSHSAPFFFCFTAAYYWTLSGASFSSLSLAACFPRFPEIHFWPFSSSRTFPHACQSACPQRKGPARVGLWGQGTSWGASLARLSRGSVFCRCHGARCRSRSFPRCCHLSQHPAEMTQRPFLLGGLP